MIIKKKDKMESSKFYASSPGTWEEVNVPDRLSSETSEDICDPPVIRPEAYPDFTTPPIMRDLLLEEYTGSDSDGNDSDGNDSNRKSSPSSPEINVEVGDIITGKVVNIASFGAFVEISPDVDGMVHISELENYRVQSVKDVVSVDEEITVKVIAIDDRGRIKLSRKALLEDQES